MKRIFTTTIALACILTATAQRSKCIVETPSFSDGIGDVNFISSQTWKIGNQEWSDAVTTTKCQKEKFYGESSYKPNADCRRNKKGYGDLFSWCAVALFSEQLCPDNWRVPTQNDFVELDKALGGNGKGGLRGSYGKHGKYGSGYGEEQLEPVMRYVKIWGLTFGGNCYPDGGLRKQDDEAYYWSADGNGLYVGRIRFTSIPIDPNYGGTHGGYSYITQGYMLRCVRTLDDEKDF